MDTNRGVVSNTMAVYTYWAMWISPQIHPRPRIVGPKRTPFVRAGDYVLAVMLACEWDAAMKCGVDMPTIGVGVLSKGGRPCRASGRQVLTFEGV